MQVGFIGLGMMGASMAANLQKAGVKLVVHDLRRASAERHLAAGAEWAASPREVASQTDVVFTSLPAPPDVDAVALGENGIIAGLKPGGAFFDLSTNSVAGVRALHKRFQERGAEMLDAPVSGGPSGAKSGKLAIWVGGDEGTYERCKKLLDAMGDEPRYLGPIGAGSIAKLVHNCTSAMLNCALAEVFTMGIKAGIEPLALWEAVRQGATGRRRTFDRLPDHFLTGEYDPPGFAFRLLHKDVSLAVQLGREVGVPMRIANLVVQELTEALNRGWGERDSSVAMLLQQERAGIQPPKVEAAKLRAILERDGQK
jgi:3-hydroxyisobutyrate dehydrogenase